MKGSSASSDKNSAFRQKCHNLWKDSRSYKERLLLAAAPSFALCFTFIFFGPIELTAFNQSSLSFSIFDITGMMAVAMTAAFVVLTLLLSLLRGKVFHYCVTAVFAFLLCGYLQGNVLNGPLGALTGEPINWQIQKTAMLTNVAEWTLLFLISYFVLYFDKKVWRNVVLLGSALLVVMQGAALVGIYAGAEEKENHYFTCEGMGEYSSEKNTLLFVVDKLDFQCIEEVLDSDPHFFDRLDGFIGYSNAVSEFPETKPAANCMLTGYTQDAWKVPAREYFDASWNVGGKNILSDLEKAGYRVDLYSDFGSLFGSGSMAEEYVSNYSSESLPVNTVKLGKGLLYLSAYRYMPVVAKPFFWLYTEDLNISAFQSGNRYNIDEVVYDNGIDKFALTGERSAFKVFHFNGAHPPYNLRADGTRSDTPTSSNEQTKGCFEIIFRALDQMKMLGIYDNAAIVISADHGSGQSGFGPMEDAVRVGLFYKPAGQGGAPLRWSKAPVSVANIPATIIKSTGADYSDYGNALDDVAEGDPVTRVCYYINAEQTDKPKIYVYKIQGDASDFKNWANTEVFEVRYSFW